MENGGTIMCAVLFIIILFFCVGNSWINYKNYKQQRSYKQEGCDLGECCTGCNKRLYSMLEDMRISRC